MERINLSSALTPPLPEIDMYVHYFFVQFNSQQFLFEQLFDIIGNFGILRPKNESTFPFQCNIIFETYPSFEPLASLLREREICVQ